MRAVARHARVSRATGRHGRLSEASAIVKSLEAWLILRSLRGVSDGTLCRLVRSFGGPNEVLAASSSDLQNAGVRSSVVKSIRKGPDRSVLKKVADDVRLIQKGACSIVTVLDSAYPSRLALIPDPPPLLYVRGTLPAADDHVIAVVGSRRATPSGMLVTRELSERLAALGFTIVSGMARGIDAAAHQGALKAKARTVAVLGCGVDRTYPPEHQPLRNEIEARGAVVSELPLGSPPLSHHFPRRNRIISGLSLGVIVSEASQNSGSLITARLALEQNREVFAIPGSIKNGKHEGAHGLIKQGAKLVEEAWDVVEELLPQLDGSVRDQVKNAGPVEKVDPVLTDEERNLLTLFNDVNDDPVPIDEILAAAPFALAEVMSLLLSLELKGVLKQTPGSCYLKC